MTKFKMAALAATSLLAATQAQAVTYVFSSGTYAPGVTSPHPLAAPDILTIDTGATKFFGSNFTNTSGRVDWTGGAIGLFNGAAVTNAGLWRALGNDSLFQSSGGGSFFNTGTFRKEASTGVTTIGVPFVNSGTIDAVTGTIQFSGSGIAFNAGTSFTGAGTNLVAGNVAFNGAFSSTNLDLSGGTYVGTGAALNGSVDFLDGNIAGSWTVNSGGTLNLTSGAAKYFGDSFTNDGTVAWSAGDVGLYNGGTVTNAGSWIATGSNQLFQSAGGGTFVNNGLFQKTAGAVTSAGGPFVNNGQVDAAAGTLIQFSANALTVNAGASFTGAGVNLINSNATFNGGFTSGNLDFAGGTYTGNAAVLNGSADLIGGNFVGTWKVGAGATANIVGTSYFADSFTNQGTVAWSAGDVGVYGGGNLVNSGSWLASGDNQIFQAAGGGTFTNDGLFRKTAGTVTSAAAPLVNNGQVDAAVGTIQFNGNALTVNAGSSFTGAGVNLINSNATFNGGFNSTNLDFTGGTFTGNAAVLNGVADLVGGNFVGNWTVGAAATANIVGTSYFADSFTNSGTVAWSGGDVGVYNGGTVTNAGSWIATSSNQLFQAAGGGTFVNDGLFSKTGGGTTSAGGPFVNNGQVDAAAGTVIQFNGNALTANAGSSFTGLGVNLINSNATFNGAFTSGNLDFTGGTFTGNAAVLNGVADLIGGNFVGTWAVGAGATANAIGTTFFTGSFTNNGTVAWSSGDIGLYGGGTFANAGTITATSDNQVFQSAGGGALVNGGLIQKTGGAGTTSINGPFTNTGTLDVESGTIQLPTNFVNAGTMAGTATFGVSGTLTNDGVIAPGSAAGAGVGTLALNGNYIQGAGGFYDVSLGAGVTDLFNITGTAALNGGLRLYCSSCTFNVGDLFTVLDSVGDLSGMFGSTSAFGFNNGFAYTVLYDTTLDRVQLRIDNAGAVTPPTNPNPGAVPEPSTWAMLIAGFGAIGAAMRRSRRRGAALA